MSVGGSEASATVTHLHIEDRSSFDAFYRREYRPLLKLAWSLTDGDLTVRATLRQEADTLLIELTAEGRSDGSGVGQPVPGTSTNVVLRDRLSFEEWTGVLIGGMIGPGVEFVNVMDAETGEILDGASTATIEDSDHVVFLTTLRDEHRDRELVVVGTTATGDEITLDAPAYG